MKTLYLDCGMGAAGDMLTAALLELLPNSDDFLEKLNSLGLPDVEYRKETTAKCGIQGTHISVRVHGEEEGEEMHEHSHEHGHEYEHSHDHTHEHEHSHEYNHAHSHEHSHEHEYEHEHEHSHDNPHEHTHKHNHEHSHVHSTMHEIQHIVEHLQIPKEVQEDIIAVYGLIAEAESKAHGKPVSQIHFHEVGTMDAIADVTAVCMLMHRLSPDEVIVSPVHVGSGQVKCAHGILPVPTPATAHILQEVPIYGGKIQGELCTPTGAALLKHFATRFGDMPIMKTQAIGYGMGKKDFSVANCVRAMLGETAQDKDTVLELSCNVDDMTAEEIGFALERLLEEGALEAFTMPAGMKKSRPGTLICVLCTEEKKQTMISLLFRHTTTIGIREKEVRRHVLDRQIKTLDTPYGQIHRKDSSGYGVTRSKYEYEDIARIAREKEISLEEVRRLLSEKNFQ